MNLEPDLGLVKLMTHGKRATEAYFILIIIL
jgi:hypothetical protein